MNKIQQYLRDREDELVKVIERRGSKMYSYYKAVFKDDFVGGYPIDYDDELIKFHSETIKGLLQMLVEEENDDKRKTEYLGEMFHGFILAKEQTIARLLEIK